MSINATTTSSVSSSAQVSGASNSTSAKKSESSFKDEMEKVTSSGKPKENDSDKKIEETADKQQKKDDSVKDSVVENDDDDQKQIIDGKVEYDKFASMSLLDANSMLTNDIRQVVNNSTLDVSMISELSDIQNKTNMIGLDFSSKISMTQADAEFFVNLTQNNDISMQNITAQVQNMLTQGVEPKEVVQSAKISETLLNALNTARENNQPLRIDFDQNVAVILRVGKDGALAANFIPGDKAVEQYLRNNIESLKNTFRENDLPYSDLSYSNRGSKQQKENRRNKQ